MSLTTRARPTRRAGGSFDEFWSEPRGARTRSIAPQRPNQSPFRRDAHRVVSQRRDTTRPRRDREDRGRASSSAFVGDRFVSSLAIMSISTQASFESGHVDQIHDCQYDYYGRVRRARSFPSRDVGEDAADRPRRDRRARAVVDRIDRGAGLNVIN
jgi:hypothetical protein